MTKNKIYLPFIIGIAIAIGIGIGTFFDYENNVTLFSSNTNEAKIKRLINYIQYDYVDEVDTDSLLDETISEMLAKLDPHSVYIPKEELQRITENMEGKFVGIGVSFLVYNDSIAVSSVIENGPSERAGLKAGDRIISANKDSLFGSYLLKKADVLEEDKETNLSNRKISNAIIKTLKGEPNTDVLVGVYRRSNDSIIKFPIVRGEVLIKSVSAHYMVSPGLGYIKIDRFARTTYDEFISALKDLISKDMTSLILDLRGNTGGFLDIANSIVDEFLEDGKLIVFTKSKFGDLDKSFATNRGNFEDGDVYVLIDQNSASASEIVAGALQDNDKGTIVGRRSFGKGLVQQEMDLGDGSAIRLTTARYYTPTGRSIQKPYDDDDSKDAYGDDYMNRIHNGELVSKDSIKVNDSLKFKTPKGKIVYGGGGIIPDVFIPIDTITTYNSALYSHINGFVFDYVDNNREDLSKYDLDSFIENFDKNDEILDEYINQLDYNKPISPQSKEDLKMYFNAFIARGLFNELGFYKITQVTDDMILKVIELNSKNIE